MNMNIKMGSEMMKRVAVDTKRSAQVGRKHYKKSKRKKQKQRNVKK